MRTSFSEDYQHSCIAPLVANDPTVFVVPLCAAAPSVGGTETRSEATDVY